MYVRQVSRFKTPQGSNIFAARRVARTRQAIDVLLLHFGSSHLEDIRPWLHETT